MIYCSLNDIDFMIGIDKVSKREPTPSGADFSFIEANLTVYDQVIDALRGCEAVIHLAAVPHPNGYGVDTHNKSDPHIPISLPKGGY